MVDELIRILRGDLEVLKSIPVTEHAKKQNNVIFGDSHKEHCESIGRGKRRLFPILSRAWRDQM